MRDVVRRVVVVVVCAAAMAGVPVAAVPTANGAACPDPATARIPVLVVHGLGGSAHTFASGPGGALIDRLRARPALLVEVFDYQAANGSWVDHVAIGPALAERIRCLADASQRGGGRGRVVVVGHSMGGLAARDAASRVEERELGLMVTLGTPHRGSRWASVALPLSDSDAVASVERTAWRWIAGGCRLVDRVAPLGEGCDVVALGDTDAARHLRVGSDTLAALPHFPAGVPVRAIGTRMTLPGLGSVGDLVVGAESATAMGQGEVLGGGAAVIDCGGIGASALLEWELPACEHRRMLSHPAVGDDVLSAIDRWLAATRAATAWEVTRWPSLTG